MSKLKRYLGLEAMVGLLALAAIPMTPAVAAAPANVGGAPHAPRPDDVSIPGASVPELLGGLGDLQVLCLRIQPWPLRPFGPYGPARPLQNGHPPKCWGGGPDFN
jgi:hypothetical protein